MRFVAINILKDVLDFLANGKVSILGGIIGARNFLFLVVFIFIVIASLCSACRLLGLTKLIGHVIFLILLLLLHLVNVHLIIFFI